MSVSVQSQVLVHQVIMAASKQHLLKQCRSFSTTLQRFKAGPNVQRPRVPHNERRILNAVTVPVFAPDSRPLPEQCYAKALEKKEAKKSEIMDQYNAFKLKETSEILSQYQMLAICHALPTTPRELLKLKTKIHLAGLKLIFFRNDLALKAIENTKLRNLEPYFTSDNAYVVSPEPKLAALIKVLKKCPEIQLLGGLVQDRIMSRDEMMNASKLPPLDILRGELLTILSASASKTSRLLTRHQSELSANLTQLVAQGSADGEVVVETGSDSSKDEEVR